MLLALATGSIIPCQRKKKEESKAKDGGFLPLSKIAARSSHVIRAINTGLIWDAIKNDVYAEDKTMIFHEPDGK